MKKNKGKKNVTDKIYRGYTNVTKNRLNKTYPRKEAKTENKSDILSVSKCTFILRDIRKNKEKIQKTEYIHAKFIINISDSRVLK